MTKKIFGAILSVAATVLAACFIIILGVMYEHNGDAEKAQLRVQAELIAKGVTDGGGAYFEGLDAGESRITWIDAGGEVLYDSEADASSLENHADREEFTEAVQTGYGESVRYSATLTERMLYCAKRLGDGTVIRVAYAESTAFAMILGMLQPIVIVMILAFALSSALASSLSKRIVRPLNALNLDEPLKNETYDELSPLLTRIERQHRQIDDQMKELRRKRGEWDAVTGSMNEGIVLLSENGMILSINKSAMKLMGAEGDCVGRDMLSVCRRIDVQQLLERAAGGEKAELVADFSGAEYQLDASPVVSSGEVKGIALLFFDVTERMRAEQMRREFTANVSHELKTPLHIIAGTAELMKNGLVAREDMPRFIERLYEESRRMSRLVNDIIELSRLDEGAENAPRIEMSLKAAAEGAAERLAPEAEKENIRIAVSGDDAKITGVPSLIGELVYNLCDNAIKYNRPGGRVDISISDGRDGAVLTVADTGVGIPRESLERIFERFYRVDKSRSKATGGTGLGLSIVKHAALLHGAWVGVESEPGRGSTFRVTFPK